MFSSCNRKLTVVDFDDLDNYREEERSDSVAFEISMAHQTKKSIAFEVIISNQSNQSIEIDPNDLFYTPEDFTYSVNAFDPDYLRFQVENPMQAVSDRADQNFENGDVYFDVAWVADVILQTDLGYFSMSGIRFFQYLAEVRDAKKVLIDEMLEKQSLKPGGRVRGLVYFPKKEFKKKDLIFINWEREEGIVNRKFLVDKW